MFSTVRSTFRKFVQENGRGVTYALIGLAIAALFLLIGVPGTLLLALFATIGFVVGRAFDGDKRVQGAMRRAANYVNGNK